MSICKCRRSSFWLILAFTIGLVGCKTTSHVASYDQNVYTKIENNWYALLDKSKFPAPKHSGETVVAFKLYPDGEIDALKVVTNTAPVSELIALQAVRESVPFPKWTDDVRHVEKKEFREFRIKFYYYDK